MTDFSEKPILAIETSGKRLKLALSFGGDRLVKLDEEVERSHGREILRKIEHLLLTAQLSQADIASIIIGIGPGSFTGLRIGLAVTKGIATALEIPVVSVSHFEVALYHLTNHLDKAKVLLPFKSDALFVGTLADGKLEPENVAVISFEDIAQILKSEKVAAVGFEPDSETGQTFVKAGIRLVEFDASDLITIGLLKLEKNDIANLADLEPLYLQKSQAEIAFEKRNK